MDAFLGVESSGDDAAVVRNGFKVNVFPLWRMYHLTLAQILVTDALNIFMGRTEVGQHTEQRYFIFVQRNAVVRLDVMVCTQALDLISLATWKTNSPLKLWRWNFAGAGFSNNVQGAIGCAFLIGEQSLTRILVTDSWQMSFVPPLLMLRR